MLNKIIILVCLLISNIAIAQPTNDDLANATIVTTLPFTDVISSADAMNATIETNEMVCVDDEAWWYVFTAPYTGVFGINAEVAGAFFDNDNNDVRLGFYTGTTHPLTELDCTNNDSGAGLGEEEALSLVAGTTYYIRVSPCDVTQILDVTFTMRIINYWTGAVSNDWSNANNWILGSVPTVDQVVFLVPGANEAVIQNGINAVANRVILGGADLDINQGGSLTVTNSSNNGVWLESVNSTLTVDGDLTITDITEVGLFCEDGIVIINSTANLNFSNNFISMRFQSDTTHTIDGTVSIDSGNGGIFVSTADSVYIGSSSVVDIKNMVYDGFVLHDEDAFLQIDGTVNIDTVTFGIFLDEGTVDVNGTLNINVTSNTGFKFQTTVGELHVNNGGILNITEAGNFGIQDALGNNAGTINITETDNDAIDTGNSTFTNTGTITIDDAGANGIDCDADFNNSGIVEIQNVTSFATTGATFNHQNGGTLSTDGAVDASNATFASGSIIAPGVNIGCMAFSGDADLSGTTINIEIDNTIPCTGYDVIAGTGNLTLTGATLNLSGNHTPTIGDEVTIIQLTTGLITGTFDGLNEGDNITFNGFQWSISYVGGDGNDVILTNAALPVELLSFEGESTENGILLSWETATEINNDYFDVEFSLDGITFEKIGQVQGAGTTLENQSYEFIDNLNQHGLYYRLKQVDFDGKHEYSNIVLINSSFSIFNSQLKIFPNPTTDFITIEINENQIGEMVQILNIQGQIVQEFLIQNTNNQYQISNLKVGTYFIQIGKTIEKIVIME